MTARCFSLSPLPREIHIHRCAMIVLHMDEDIAQGWIMEYIIEHAPNVQGSMLNDVPMYVRGYRVAMERFGHE